MAAKPETADLLDTPAESQALAPRPEAGEFVSLVERLATNPAVDVVKLEKIIELQERILRHNAKAAFDEAFSRMQPEIPEIDEKGQIAVKGVVRSTYAKLEDINRVIKPILKQFGFSIRHRTEWPEDHKGIIRVVGILGHKDGHSEESAFEAPMDRSEFRTDIQSEGSTVSYGRRYTTIDLLNISTRGQDDDGAKSGRPQPPDGYEDFKITLSSAAEKGLSAVEQTFSKADIRLRNYLTNHDAQDYAKIRTRARTGRPAQS